MVSNREKLLITVTRELLDVLRAHRIAHRWGGGERWRAGENLHMADDCELEPYCHILSGHVLPARMGAFSYSHSMLLPSLRMGRYCSIGGGVEFLQSQHPVDWASTSPFSYSLRGLQGFLDYLQLDKKLTAFPLHPDEFLSDPVELGNDVWVGQGAMLSGGIKVGHGAVIAARALVTHDVPPYAIVGGSPAKVIRMRFPDEVVRRLLKLQWWRFGPDVLQPLDVRDVEGFTQRLEAQLAQDAPQALALIPLTAPQMRGASAKTA
jgi:acetyltransferase-like isoleucine patch superfamily enzyme